MTNTDLSNTIERFIKNSKLEVVECIPYSNTKDAFGHLIECVYTLSLTYRPTGNSMVIFYEKSPFEAKEVMKYVVLSSLRNEIRDFRCGGWRRLVDQYGMFYANEELVNTGVSESTNKAWEQHKLAVKNLFQEDYEQFMNAF